MGYWTRYSRGRPDYGDSRGRRPNGRFRGGGRYMRYSRPNFDPNYHRSSYVHYCPNYGRQPYHSGEEFRSHSRYYPHSQRHRYRRSGERHSRSLSNDSERSDRESRKRARSPSPSYRTSRVESSRERDSSESSVLSNISSASSLFTAPVDSSTDTSANYDAVSSEPEDSPEIASTKRKKRKKGKKKKERERKHRKKEKKRKKEIHEERIRHPDKQEQAKEFFESIKNILVSVNFPEDEEDSQASDRNHRKTKKKKSSKKKSKYLVKTKEEKGLRKKLEDSSEYPFTSHRKRRKIDDNVKPIAIIDLDRSPGKQVISSPREIIVLSDEEGVVKNKHKIINDLVGPNTPPEPAPKSPESFDPFDPTKSPTHSPLSGENLGSISTVSYPVNHHQQHHHHRHAHLRLLKDLQSANEEDELTLHPSSPNSTRGQYRLSPLKAHRPSPQKKANATATVTSGALMSGASSALSFGDDLDDGDISPYSPRSSDCDDNMFEPPLEGSNSVNGSGHQTKTIALTVDNLRKVFGNDKNTLYGDLRRPNEAVQLVDEMYKPQRVTMEMLDDIPNSAVDLQIKEKLIQKLQRQDRIIEEVKHFLKPHFNKKRISKEDYKDIMKKSVPKICHSRSGEINPVKIQNLINAYVKKTIAKRRLGGNAGNAIVSSTTAVT